MTRIAGRLVLPVLLALAACGAWFGAGWFGDLSVEQVAAAPPTSVETPIISVARLPDVARASQRSALQQGALDALPSPNASLACAAIYLDGELLWSVNPDAALIPGFAQLAVTAHTALESLGPRHRFETRVVAPTQPDANGVLSGNLYVVGSGDPVLMSYNYARTFRPIQSTYTPIETLADALIDAGLTQLNGAVVAVDDRFDRTRVVSGLPDGIVSSGLVGSMSALQLDDGLAERPGANGGVAVLSEEPAQLVAEAIDRLLREREVRIGAPPRLGEATEVETDLQLVASVQSPTLGDIAFQMLAVNDASAAEMLVKELGVQLNGSGSTQAGGEAVVRAAEALGVDLSVAPRGGSGLDPVSFSSCREIGSFVAAIPAEAAMLAALPTYDLPGVYGGLLGEVVVDAEMGAVGGQIGEVASFVARTTDDGLPVTVVSIVNRPTGARLSDVAYHRDLISHIDDLRAAFDPQGEAS